MKDKVIRLLTHLIKPIVLYTIGALFCHFFSAWFSLNLEQSIYATKWQYTTAPASVQMWTRIGVVYPVSFVASLVALWMLLQKMIPTFYFPLEHDKECKIIAMIVLLPGELVRYAICLSSMGSLLGSGRFAVIPANWFNQLWWALAARFEVFLAQGKSSPLGFLVFTLCYIAYLIVYLFVVFKIFRYFWNITKWEREDLGSQVASKVNRNF